MEMLTLRSLRTGRGKLMQARSALLVIGAAIALLVGGGAAYAAISGGPVDSSGVIHGCFTTKAVNGSHKLELQDEGTSCPRGTTAVSWNEAGSGGLTGSAGSVSLSDLQGSPCVVGSLSSTLNVSVNPTTGAVTMTCPPPNGVSVIVSGGTLSAIAIFDDTNSTGTNCVNASSCSFPTAAGDAIRVGLESGNIRSGGGKTFTYTCGGSPPQTAISSIPGDYRGNCPVGGGDLPLTGHFAVTVSF